MPVQRSHSKARSATRRSSSLSAKPITGVRVRRDAQRELTIQRRYESSNARASAVVACPGADAIEPTTVKSVSLINVVDRPQRNLAKADGGWTQQARLDGADIH